MIVYKLTPDGDLVPEPLFTKPTLADPAHKFRIQGAGPIHIHPNGRFVYLGNRSGLASAAGPGVEDVDGKMVFSAGESNIAVFAINQQTGEPTAIQHADIRAAHPRTFGLDTGARLLVAGSLAREREAGGRQGGRPAGRPYRVPHGRDGKLDFARKYDIDVGPSHPMVDRHDPARMIGIPFGAGTWLPGMRMVCYGRACSARCRELPGALKSSTR